ncbi:MAG TPA: TIGR04086 family membrane protein [Roseiflexaceae bacterium]|nr:TIGR04086 family membrane protein [Roseiflexaceae bacterium]
MVHRDWLDELRWDALLGGIAGTVVLQIALTLLVLRPLGLTMSWAGVALVELCVAAGAFWAGWRAPQAALAGGLSTALAGAALSLLATALRTPAQITPLSMLFLFGTFALMGALGGWLGGTLGARRSASGGF